MENADRDMFTRSALVELTPLEYEKDLLNDQMERCLTQHLASRILLGWVDGILRPLPMVVHRTAQNEPGSRIKDMSGDDRGSSLSTALDTSKHTLSFPSSTFWEWEGAYHRTGVIMCGSKLFLK